MTTPNNTNHDFRAPLARARGWGSAHAGMHHWYLQRLTALGLIPLVIWFVWSVLHLTMASQLDVVSWVQGKWHAIPLALLITVGLWHGSLGVQVVIEDYVHGKAARFGLIVATKFAAIILGVSVLYAILLMSLAGGVHS